MISRREVMALPGLVAVGPGASSRDAAQGAAAPSGGEELQRRYDALAAGGGGTLDIPAGTFRTSLDLHSRRVHVRGAGRGATVLKPGDPARPVLLARYADAAWDAVTISDLSVEGDGGRGTGLAHPDDPQTLFAGRTIVRNVKFAGLETCVLRPAGNIGLWLEDCQFEEAAHHIRGESARSPGGEVMHNGVLHARRCHFQRATAAVMRSRSDVAGTGQVTFEDCVFENNPGFVLVLERFEGREAVPGIVLRSCWNEGNATGGRARALTLAGRKWEPAFLFANGVAQIECRDTPVGRVILLGDTSLTTHASALDMFEIAHADPAATVTHHEARVFGGKTVDGLTQSLTNANLKNTGPTGAFFRLPHRSGVARPVLRGAHDVSACREPILLRGTRNIATSPARDAILPGEAISQDVALGAGDHVFLNDMNTRDAGVFVGWTFSYRLLDGAPPELQVTGDVGLSTTTPLEAADWTTLGGIAFAPRPIAHLGFWLKAAGPARLRVGGFQLICFPDRREAVEMLNDRLFRNAAG